jgi:hypothetical protein
MIGHSSCKSGSKLNLMVLVIMNVAMLTSLAILEEENRVLRDTLEVLLRRQKQEEPKCTPTPAPTSAPTPAPTPAPTSAPRVRTIYAAFAEATPSGVQYPLTPVSELDKFSVKPVDLARIEDLLYSGQYVIVRYLQDPRRSAIQDSQVDKVYSSAGQLLGPGISTNVVKLLDVNTHYLTQNQAASSKTLYGLECKLRSSRAEYIPAEMRGVSTVDELILVLSVIKQTLVTSPRVIHIYDKGWATVNEYNYNPHDGSSRSCTIHPSTTLSGILVDPKTNKIVADLIQSMDPRISVLPAYGDYNVICLEARLR